MLALFLIMRDFRYRGDFSVKEGLLQLSDKSSILTSITIDKCFSLFDFELVNE